VAPVAQPAGRRHGTGPVPHPLHARTPDSRVRFPTASPVASRGDVRTLVDYEVLAREGDYVRLLLRGELVEDVGSERIKRSLERHYVDDGVRTIVVDLSELDLVSLDGIETLVELWKESVARGKRFVLRGATGQVEAKLRTTGLLGPLSEDH
jgi:anti-anti-sigma regulatory factor